MIIIDESVDEDLSVYEPIMSVYRAENDYKEMMVYLLFKYALIVVISIEDSIRSGKTTSCSISTASLDAIHQTVLSK